MLHIGLGIFFATYVALRTLDKNPIKKKKYILKRKKKSMAIVQRNAQQDLNIAFVCLGAAIIQPLIFPYLSFINPLLLSYSAYPYLRIMERDIYQRKFTNDILGGSWALLSVASGQYIAAALGNVIYHIGTDFIQKTRDQSRKSLVSIFDSHEQMAWVLKNGLEIELPVVEVKIGDIVVVSSGGMIPIDGVIIQGNARIDQHTLTGESQPFEKTIEDLVFASTVVISGTIHIKVEKAGNNTVVAKIEQALQKTSEFKTQLQLKGELWADQVAPYLFITAGIVAFTIGPIPAAAVIAAQFGYQIRIILPLSTLQHLSYAMHAGILVKDGRSLEALQDIDTVLFDKTGTLTEEQPEVGEIISWFDKTDFDILYWAAIAEHKLQHPIAQAILQTYNAHPDKQPLPDLQANEYQVGLGSKVVVNQKIIRVGSLRFMRQEGLELQEDSKLHAYYKKGNSLVFVAVDNNIIGAIEIQPKIRQEAHNIIKRLKKRGIKQCFIVSGDQYAPTEQLAQILGVDGFFAEVLPQDKAKIVDKLQEDGYKVCFIGDGINDTIAMKKANVSISLQGASQIATDTADILLMQNNLSGLLPLFDIAKKLQGVSKINFLMVTIPAVLILSGSLLLHMGLLLAVFIKNGFLGINTLYVLNNKPKIKKISNYSK